MSRTRRGPWAALGLAGVAGALVALQSRYNGELGDELDDPYLAALVSCTVGVVALLIATCARPTVKANLRESFRLMRARAFPVWALSGGLAGAFLVLAQSASIRSLGVSLFTVGTVAGQAASGIVLDRLGLGTDVRIAIRPVRVLGACVAVVAVIMTGVGVHAQSNISWLLVLPMLAGLGMGWQAAVNGRLRQATGSALTATLLNFSVGWIVLSVVSGTALLFTGWPMHWPTNPLPYLGGLLGVAYVGISVYLVRTTGVLLLGLAIVAGQLLAAVLLDLLMPLGPQPGPSTLIGAIVALVAVMIAARRDRSEAGR